MIDGDGKITTEELRRIMISLGQDPTEDELQRTIEEVDVDRNGTVDIDEFLTIMAAKKQFSDAEILKAFKALDANGDGTVSAAELKKIMTQLGRYPL